MKINIFKKKKREKDSMPKEHDPKREREREKRWHAKEA